MRKKFYRWLSMAVFCLLLCKDLMAQQKITGIVKDGAGLVMPGVSVLVKGTNRGTVTDANGAFSLDADANEVLVLSFIGYKQQEIAVGQNTVIEAVMIEDVLLLNEVVVSIGYGESKLKDVTGAISTVSEQELRRTNAITFEQAIQGKVPGVVVQQISGQPGGAVSVQIRGISNFSGAGPMYVVDGIIIGNPATLGAGTNPLAGINLSDIESVGFLKDAPSTAIYGSQATNGVVVIKTKRGRAGESRLTYDFYTGFQQLPRRLPLMNLQEYATFINERNTGMGWGFDSRPEFVNPQYLGKGTDWQEELFRNAPMSNHSLTVSGGDEKTQYLLSGGYSKQEGIAVGSDIRRITLRLNLDNQTTNWLKIGTSLQLANIKENVNTTSSNVINTALSQTPDIPVKNSDGSWGGAYNPNGWVNSTVNPYAIATINKDEVKRSQAIGSVYAEMTFIDDLSLRTELTGTFSMATEDKFFPTYEMGLVEQNTNSATYEYSQSAYTTIRNYLTYAHTFNNIFNVNVMVGHEAQENRSERVGAGRSNFPSNNVQVISSGNPTTASNSGVQTQNSLESYFGRLNIGFHDKYLITGNIRADGSSKFSPDRRWVTTYSGAVAWKIHNEEFLSFPKVVNDLKLRAGYGLTNNQNIRDYAYTSTLATVPTGLSGIAQLTQNVANPYAEWETTKYANVGLDAAFLSSRLSFTVDFYNRRTDGLLMQIPLPLYSGTATSWSPGSLDAPYVNVGSINNKGFDFRISSNNVMKGSFTWNTDLTVSRNINEILKLNTDGASLPGWPYSNSVVGKSIGQFYGYQVDGVFSTKEDFETHALPVKNGVPLAVGAAGGSIWYGDLMFKDLNGDGIINELDQTFLGSPIPKVQLGLNNSFSYKNFELNIFFTANYGNKVFNQVRINGEYPGTSFGYMKALNNYAKLGLIDPEKPATDIDNVYVINPDTDIPGIRNDNTNENTRPSDRYVEDGSFIRCRSLSLGYRVSDRLLSKARLGALKLYVNVQNAFLITKYKGMDPEIGSWNPLSAGYDNGYYPQSRVFTVGANLQINR